MKQLTILGQSAVSGEGLSKLLRKHSVVGTTSWTAEAVYQSPERVHYEFREGMCRYITTVIKDESLESLATDLAEFNERLEPGNRFIFWVVDVESVHLPWLSE